MRVHSIIQLFVFSITLLETSCDKNVDTSAVESDDRNFYERVDKNRGRASIRLPKVQVGIKVKNQKAASGKTYGWGQCKLNKKGKNCNKDVYDYGCHQPISNRVPTSACRASYNRDSTTVIAYQVYTNAAKSSTAIQCSSVVNSDSWQSQTNLNVGGNAEILYLVYDSYGSSGYFSGGKTAAGYVLGYRVLQSRSTTYKYYVSTSTDGKTWTQQACKNGCPQLSLYTQTQVYRSITLNLWIGIEVYQSKYYLTTSPDLSMWKRGAQVLITEKAGYGKIEITITQFVILQEGISVEDTLYCFLGNRPGSTVVNYYIGRIQNGTFSVQFGPRPMDYGPDGGIYTFADETYVENGVTVTDVVLYSTIKNTYFMRDGYEEFFGTTRYVIGNYHCPGFPLRQYSKTDFYQVIGDEKTIGTTTVAEGVNAFAGLMGRTFSAHVVVIRETAQEIQFGVHGNSAGAFTCFGYDNGNQLFYVDRTKSPYPSGKNYASGLAAYAKKFTFPLNLVQEILALFIIVDENTVEIGYDNGNVWVTTLSFSQANNVRISLKPVRGTFVLYIAELKFFTKSQAG